MLSIVYTKASPFSSIKKESRQETPKKVQKKEYRCNYSIDTLPKSMDQSLVILSFLNYGVIL